MWMAKDMTLSHEELTSQGSATRWWRELATSKAFHAQVALCGKGVVKSNGEEGQSASPGEMLERQGQGEMKPEQACNLFAANLAQALCSHL